MINSRLTFDRMLKEEIMHCDSVYFQPPSSLKLKYPCIVYNLNDINDKKADEISDDRHYQFRLTLISPNPDNNIVDKIMNLKYAKYVRSFSTQGLYHYMFDINFKNEKEN